ncbi:MAG: UDP-3-O-(3-hydroxymyristoyl)glucosamine N-acyltransferase [Fimbriimonadaceae bacterium]
MVDQTAVITASTIAEWIGGRLEGNPDQEVRRPVLAGESDPFGVTFAEKPHYLEKVESGEIGAVLLPEGLSSEGRTVIYCERPRQSFLQLLHRFQRPETFEPGIDPTARISDGAEVDPTAYVGAYTVVESGAKIGAGCRLQPHVFVGQDVSIGEETTLHSQVVIYPGSEVGSNVVIHAGAVIGADGFGYFWDGEKQHKIPQVGKVRIGDHAEIGANTTIDRAMAGDTVIESGVKIDNLVQIGHNTRVGAHSVLASQTGISGSCILGERVVCGGQVGISHGITIGDDVKLGGKTGVADDLPKGGDYFGIPARNAFQTMKIMTANTKLPEMYRRLKELERTVERLQKELDER